MSRKGSKQFDENNVMSAALKARFALSDAETQIALTLAEGAGLAEISRSRGVTLHTIRSQLKAIFHKTGAKSQAKLVAIIFRI